MYGIGLAIVGALYYRNDVHFCHYICNLVVFDELSILIDCLILAPEPLFTHELESKNNVPLRINTKHVADQKAALNLVLRHIKYVARP